jgi:hypothetical protein
VLNDANLANLPPLAAVREDDHDEPAEAEQHQLAVARRCAAGGGEEMAGARGPRRRQSCWHWGGRAPVMEGIGEVDRFILFF